MTDLLDRLRAANPVPDPPVPYADRFWHTLSADADADASAAPEAQAPLAAVCAATPGRPSSNRRRRVCVRPETTARRSRARRLALGLAPLAAAATALVLLGVIGGPGAPSVAARAYAATTPTGVIDHYVEVSRVRLAPGNPPLGYTDARSEVWSSGIRTHVVSTDYVVSADGHRSLQHAELAIDGRRATNLFGGNTLSTSMLPPPGAVPIRACLTVLVCDFEPVDPITTMRDLYRAGRLHDAGQIVQAGHRLDVLAGGQRATTGAYPGSGVAVRILVDPRTFVPVEVVTSTYGALGSERTVRLLETATTTITDYRRIPLTPQTSELLAMRPHPGAHTICAPTAPAPHAAPADGLPVLVPC